MAPVAAVLAGLILLGSCSGEDGGQLSHEEYQQGIQAVVRSDDAGRASRLFFDSVANSYEPEQCATRVRELHERLRSVLEQVAELRPPADAEAAQREFLAAARESVRLVGVAADDAASGELRCGPPLNSRIYGMPSTERARAAITKLEAIGYVVFGE